MKRVLSVASEAVPLVKTGGLADVVGALPAALSGQGWQMRVLIPAYRGVLDKLGKTKVVWSDDDLFGGPARVVLGKVGGVEAMALDAPHLFDRAGGPYSDGQGDYWDNAERFAALSWVAARIARDGVGDWRPDVLHAHDWQGALAPGYMRYWGVGIPSVLTIHNMAFQGRVGANKISALRLPPEQFTPDGYEYWGDISTLKAGLTATDAITTVSPRYAEELMRGEFGLGLEGVIQARAASVHGFLNGIDPEVWSPDADPHITPFTAARMAGKARNRAALEAEFGLEVPGPLAILVSRLTPQKGIDLLPGALEDFIAGGGGLAILGSGDAWAEDMVRGLATRYPGRVGVRIGYDEALSHRMFAGGDAVLVPSRFEPCGLTQLYGLRYGCVPVVAAVGGLADTVIGATPATEAAGAATGIVFHPVDELALRQSMRRLLSLYADCKGWAAMVRRGMKADWGWEASAARYAALYDSLIAP
ncbi:glycogen synthase GlgA [Sinirhodobacter sp. WL0062]|uniref:Glycogen synthase n=1 Tax=Rhodobacter flavimaris TaxID=2907145 RepID=A0ABS8YUV9_9RHOB|nr:glycogen synthase GlgA [Sinirhodobacter sp. WL0062]MCE5972236.1 glycogen synthase GlgA [Sinirhodobacter sp. WL0062]